MPSLDPSFPHAYRVAAVDRQVGENEATIVRFSGISELAAETPMSIRIEPDGSDPWYAEFVGFSHGNEVLTGLYSHPDPYTLCAVSEGQAYFVDTSDRLRWLAIRDILPITAVLQIPPYELIVLADFRKLAAYGRDGKVWQTREISYDGIDVRGYTNGVISGESWSAPDDHWVSFDIDLKTGEVRGGAELG